MRFWLMTCAMLLALGCDNDLTGPTVALNTRFTLAPGETATVGDSRLRVQFLRVSGDSRCPADAICIQGGDALVHVRIGEGGSGTEYELHTGDSARAAVVHRDLRVELVELQPYPFGSRPPIGADDYRATLRASTP